MTILSVLDVTRTLATEFSWRSRLPAEVMRTAASESCSAFLMSGRTGEGDFPQGFGCKKPWLGLLILQERLKYGQRRLSDPAPSAWAAAALTEGSGCRARSVATKTAV